MLLSKAAINCAVPGIRSRLDGDAVAARGLEVARTRGALLRAEELACDVAAAIESACD